MLSTWLGFVCYVLLHNDDTIFTHLKLCLANAIHNFQEGENDANDPSPVVVVLWYRSFPTCSASKCFICVYRGLIGYTSMAAIFFLQLCHRMSHSKNERYLLLLEAVSRPTHQLSKYSFFYVCIIYSDRYSPNKKTLWNESKRWTSLQQCGIWYFYPSAPKGSGV